MYPKGISALIRNYTVLGEWVPEWGAVPFSEEQLKRAARMLIGVRVTEDVCLRGRPKLIGVLSMSCEEGPPGLPSFLTQFMLRHRDRTVCADPSRPSHDRCGFMMGFERAAIEAYKNPVLKFQFEGTVYLRWSRPIPSNVLFTVDGTDKGWFDACYITSGTRERTTITLLDVEADEWTVDEKWCKIHKIEPREHRIAVVSRGRVVSVVDITDRVSNAVLNIPL